MEVCVVGIAVCVWCTLVLEGGDDALARECVAWSGRGLDQTWRLYRRIAVRMFRRQVIDG